MDWAPLRLHSAAATAADRNFKPAPPPTADIRPMEVDAGPQQPARAAGDASEQQAEKKARDEKAAAARVEAAMARVGPSIRVEDLDTASAPFASHVPLEAPSKYRCVAVVHRRMRPQLICSHFGSNRKVIALP